MSRTNRTALLAIGIAVLLGAAAAMIWQGGHRNTVRGALVAGVPLGGLAPAAAQARLARALPELVAGPITLRTEDGAAEFTAQQLGLAVDVPATVERAVSARTPLRDGLGALTSVSIEPVVRIDRARFDAALAQAKTLVRDPREGAVVFRDGRPVPIEPAPGDRIPLDGAAAAVARAWPAAHRVTLPTAAIRPTVSAREVHAVAAGAGARAVASEVALRRDGTVVARATPSDIGAFLSFRPDGDGALVPRIDRVAAQKALAPRLADEELPAREAGFDLGGGVPTVTESKPGREVQWGPTVDAVAAAAVGGGTSRAADVVFRELEPTLTTDKARTLGVREVVSEFTTGGFAAASGVNIRRVAAEVDGAVVLPGATFSLNKYTGHRGKEQGYVEAGIILDGRPDKAVGGGISQFATTLYNAAYFAGLADAGHTEHSYYISRYPEAREATVFEGSIDLRFRNDTKSAVLIEAVADDSEVTVRLWSTKTREVSSATGSRSRPTEPRTIRLPKGPHCVPSAGQPGFTTSDTRTIREGEDTRSSTRTVKYDPVPIVICE